MADAVSDHFGDQQPQVEDRLDVLVEAQLVDRTASGAGGFDGGREFE